MTTAACRGATLVDVLRDRSAEDAFRSFLIRFSHLTYLNSVVILELRAGAPTAQQARLLERKVIRRFTRMNRVFTPSADAFSTAGRLLASLATREGWTVDAEPSLMHDALLAASCRESGVTLITCDRDFARFKNLLRGLRFAAPWPQVS